MKKLVCVLLCICLLAALFAGCIAYFECDLCGEETFGIKHTGELMGEEVEYCDDCKEDMEELKDQFFRFQESRARCRKTAARCQITGCLRCCCLPLQQHRCCI